MEDRRADKGKIRATILITVLEKSAGLLSLLALGNRVDRLPLLGGSNDDDGALSSLKFECSDI
jgi:hypothetical protein